jgi:hypothetical protein
MPSPSSQHFQVRKDDLRNVRIVSHAQAEQTPLGAGEVRFRIDRFALTSNNITYAAFGDRMKYWDFYPAEDGWGVIPVWGFADVVVSTVDGVKRGERFYGYFPMSSHVTLKVAKASAGGFTEGTELRQALAAVYNQYTRTAADPPYDKARESEQALLKPLFITSWLVADMLADNQFFGAQMVILSSASSKTAYGTAHAIKQLPGPRPQVMGLTSQRNKAFTQSLGCYDEVRTYEEIGAIPTTSKAVYVDMSGDAPVRAALHSRFSDQLAYSCSVGGTHWENLAGGGALAGPRPQLFFAPAQIRKRAAEWGPSELQTRMGKAWTGFLPQLGKWLQVVESRGPDAIKQTYLTVLDGKAGPHEGHMLGF